jgi:hypothetical protein
MAKRRVADGKNLDELLRNWEYVPGQVTARLARAVDGREVIQMRVDMGVLQLEVDNRPDGTRPGGAETYYDYLVGLAVADGDEFELTEEQCLEVDREFMQFYQRRLCWLAMKDFARAMRDADHNLGLMDFVSQHSPSEEWTASHEQYRPFVLFHRTYAAAMAEVEGKHHDRAIDEINKGLDRVREFFIKFDALEHFDQDELVEQLVKLRESLRARFEVGKTLNEQLNHAVANEQYELAARLRDKIAKRRR